jgi:nitroreductase
MEKRAACDHSIDDLLARRWSPRAFSERAVDAETVCSLLEAARWAPSCFNEQPWSFIVATKENPEVFSKLLGCLREANQIWARQAPVLMVAVAKAAFDHNGKPNRHSGHDVGLAVENLMLQAVSMGLFAHAMAGFDAGRVREAYGVPEGHDPLVAIALGYPGDPGMLPDDLKERETAPRERKPLVRFVFGRFWGNSWEGLRENRP